jgi:hypothetical protein
MVAEIVRILSRSSNSFVHILCISPCATCTALLSFPDNNLRDEVCRLSPSSFCICKESKTDTLCNISEHANCVFTVSYEFPSCTLFGRLVTVGYPQLTIQYIRTYPLFSEILYFTYCLSGRHETLIGVPSNMVKGSTETLLHRRSCHI